MKPFLAIASLALCATLSAEPQTLKIGVADPLCRESACSCVTGVLREYAEMTKAVEKETGVRLELSYFEEEELLKKEIERGAVDGVIGKVSVFAGCARDAKRDYERLADISKPDGGVLLKGVFIVLKDSPLKSLADAKGGKFRFLFGEEDAPEKSELAFKTLSRLSVAVPARSARQTCFSCKEGALALLERRADVAVISDYALEFGCIVVVGRPEDFRVIGSTDEAIPFTSFMVDKAKVSAELRAKLAKALLAIRGDAVPAELLSKGWREAQPWPENVKLP